MDATSHEEWKQIILRVRSTGRAFSINYQSSNGKTIPKQAGICLDSNLHTPHFLKFYYALHH